MRKTSIFWRLFAIVLSVLLAANSGLADDRQSVSGMALSLALPEGLEQGDFGPGVFANAEITSIIEVHLLSIEYFKYFVSGRKDVEAELYKGSDEVTVEQLDLGEHSFTLFSGTQIIRGSEVEVRTAFTGPYPSYSLVFTQSPAVDKPLLNRQGVIDILTSLQVEEPLPFAEQLALVGISIQPEDPFAFNEVVNSQAIFMSPIMQSYENPNGLSATLVVVPDWDPSLSLGEIERRDFHAARDLSRQELLFAGAEGSRIQAIQDDPAEGPYSHIQYLTVLDDRLVVFSVWAPLPQMTPELEAIIDRMATSVELAP